jgi:hypothetical protein
VEIQASREVWSEDRDERAFVPEADIFVASLADGKRAVEVRAGFMEALIQDPRSVRHFLAWLDACERHAAELKAGKKRQAPMLDVETLVRDELGLPWGWLTTALLDVFHRMVLSKTVEAEQVLPAEEARVLAPPLCLWFSVEVGESNNDARKRLTDLYEGAIAEFDAADRALSGGIATRQSARRRRSGTDDADTGHLRDYGRWFYKARVANPVKSIRAVAFESKCDRSTVRDGIAEAERLLSIGAYALPPGGKARGRDLNYPPGGGQLQVR